MRAAAHTAIAGLGAFGAVIALKQKYPDARLPAPVLAGVVAALASGIPDYLEPAISPNHRQFCHSVAFAAALVSAMKQLYGWEPTTPGEIFGRDVLLSVGFGYLAHLGADATTAAGLPLLGRFN